MLDNFFGAAEVTTLSEDRETLEFPIHESEVMDAINKLKLNKPSGIDGLSAEFCKKFKQKLAPLLMGIFEACLREKKFPPSWTESKIILIHKLGKDQTLSQTYLGMFETW